MSPATQSISDLPGPRGWPLIGNLLDFDPNTLHSSMERWAQEFGPFFRVRYGPRRCPGRNLASAEMRSVVLMIARNFDLQGLTAAGPVCEKLSFTLVPDNLRIRLAGRADGAGEQVPT